jgi:hypothetical protein
LLFWFCFEFESLANTTTTPFGGGGGGYFLYFFLSFIPKFIEAVCLNVVRTLKFGLQFFAI